MASRFQRARVAVTQATIVAELMLLAPGTPLVTGVAEVDRRLCAQIAYAARLPVHQVAAADDPSHRALLGATRRSLGLAAAGTAGAVPPVPDGGEDGGVVLEF